MTEKLNFNLPIDFSRLENDRLKLVPFEENLAEWADIYIQDALQHPEVFDYLTYGPFASTQDYITFYNSHSRPSPHELLLAIIIKPGTTITRTHKDPSTNTTTTTTQHITTPTFAGLSGLGTTPSPSTSSTLDLGQLLLTPYHRTFIGTSANSLLLHHALDPPSLGGLGLRRVQWQANAANQASVSAAQRLGFTLEGVIRWQQVLPVGKAGVEGEGLPRGGWDGERGWRAGRHTAVLAVCWDDWEGVVRERVDGLVERGDK